jgi:hypothetical protein
MTNLLSSSIFLSFHNIGALNKVSWGERYRVLSIQRTLWIWFGKHALYTQQDCLDIVDCGPFLLEDVETDVVGHVNVWVVHWRDEDNMRGGV